MITAISWSSRGENVLCVLNSRQNFWLRAGGHDTVAEDSVVLQQQPGLRYRQLSTVCVKRN